MKMKYMGEEAQIICIMGLLHGKTKAVRVTGKSITLPTETGNKAFYVGDMVVIENGLARLDMEAAND